MTLTEEQKELLAELVSADMPAKEVAEALGVDTPEFIRLAFTPGTEIYGLYKSAEHLSNALFLRKVSSNARIGIPQSQSLQKKIIEEKNLNNLKSWNDANII